jgi:hypothetical protein
MKPNEASHIVIGAAIKVHTALGAGILESAYFIVENCLVVEIKCVEKLQPVHRAQVLTYLKLSGHKLGLLINFNIPHLRHGIHRVINGPESEL